MRESLILEFPLKEYEARIGVLREKLKEYGMEGIILTMSSNVRYFCGLRSIVWTSNRSMPGVLVINADGKMRVISQRPNDNTARVTCCAEEDEFITFKRGSSILSFPEALGVALRDLKLERSKIGLEYGEGFRIRMTMEDYEIIRSEFKEAQFADAARLLWDIRSIKSPLEIERLRKSSKINSRAFEGAFEKIVPGKSTEDEIYQYMAATCFQLGAETMLELELHGRKDRYANYNCPSSWLTFATEPGTMISIDGGPGYRGYYSDITRVGVIGQPSEKQKELYKIASEGFWASLDALKPGRTAEEVCRIADAWFDKAGVGDIFVSRGWIGHCVGLDVHEYPCLAHGDETVIKPGMVFAVEPFIYNDIDGSFGIEDNLLVTENGYEMLSDASRELFCVR